MKYLKLTFYLLITGITFLPANIIAQVNVTAQIDTSMMLIGDQTKFRLQATLPKNYNVQFQLFSDTIIDKLEIVETFTPDTITENGVLKITNEYIVTSFDTGWYQINPVKFIVKHQNTTDTLYSNPVYFGVITMPIDTTNANAIADIKKPVDAPLTIKEILPYAGYSFAVLAILFLAFILYKKFAKKQPVFVTKQKPKEPAHIIAYRQLEQLSQAKLWQKGDTKEYYSQLTEILRQYIENRFNIPALEQTTDEIISSFRNGTLISKELKDNLFDLLTRADFVKFAKATPLASENETGFNFCYNFIDNTKITEQLRDENENNNQHNNNKIVTE